MSHRPEHLAPGYVRAAGLLTLLVGIVVMHSFVASHASAHPSEHLAAQPNLQRAMSPDTAAGRLAMPLATPADPAVVFAAPAASTTMPPAAHHVTPGSQRAAVLTSMTMPGAGMGPGCAGGCCVMAGGMHACVFILTALVLLLGLAVLGRVGGDTHADGRFGHGWRIRSARPPPWTMPSLAELSILRI